MKQTAIEWLIFHWLELDKKYYGGEIGRIDYRNRRDAIQEDAKEMEKQHRKHFVELSKWIIENKRSVFEDADISTESKRKILNELGYSSGDY